MDVPLFLPVNASCFAFTNSCIGPTPHRASALANTAAKMLITIIGGRALFSHCFLIFAAMILTGLFVAFVIM